MEQGARIVDDKLTQQLSSLLDEVIRNCERIKKDIGENKVTTVEGAVKAKLLVTAKLTKKHRMLAEYIMNQPKEQK